MSEPDFDEWDDPSDGARGADGDGGASAEADVHSEAAWLTSTVGLILVVLGVSVALYHVLRLWRAFRTSTAAHAAASGAGGGDSDADALAALLSDQRDQESLEHERLQQAQMRAAAANPALIAAQAAPEGPSERDVLRHRLRLKQREAKGARTRAAPASAEQPPQQQQPAASSAAAAGAGAAARPQPAGNPGQALPASMRPPFERQFFDEVAPWPQEYPAAEAYHTLKAELVKDDEDADTASLSEDDLKTLKAELVRRAMAIYEPLRRMETVRPALEQGKAKGAIPDEVWDDFMAGRVVLAEEIEAIRAEAQGLKDGWEKEILDQAVQLRNLDYAKMRDKYIVELRKDQQAQFAREQEREKKRQQNEKKQAKLQAARSAEKAEQELLELLASEDKTSKKRKKQSGGGGAASAAAAAAAGEDATPGGESAGPRKRAGKKKRKGKA